MGFKVKTLLFFSLLVLYFSILIYSGKEINFYIILLSLFLCLSPVCFFMSFGANRIDYLLAYTKEKRDLVNNCEDQSIDKFKAVVSEHFSTKQHLEQLHLLVYLHLIQQGATLILHAVANNSPKIIKYLIEEKGYNVDLQSKNKETALMRAVVKNNIELTKLILSYKPNLDLVNQVTFR